MKNWTSRDTYSVIMKDALGLEWVVKEARPTKHGFDLYLGKRRNPSPYEIGGLNRLIYTHELQEFWQKHSLRHDGILFDLPAGRTTLKRARTALGFHWHKDSESFWRKHKSDLSNLKPQAFTAKCEQDCRDQRITGDRMKAWRFRLLGGRARSRGWWRKPEIIKLFLSELTIDQIRAQLVENISHTQATRIRFQARNAYGIANEHPIQSATESAKFI